MKPMQPREGVCKAQRTTVNTDGRQPQATTAREQHTNIFKSHQPSIRFAIPHQPIRRTLPVWLFERRCCKLKCFFEDLELETAITGTCTPPFWVIRHSIESCLRNLWFKALHPPLLCDYLCTHNANANARWCLIAQSQQEANLRTKMNLPRRLLLCRSKETFFWKFQVKQKSDAFIFRFVAALKVVWDNSRCSTKKNWSCVIK